MSLTLPLRRYRITASRDDKELGYCVIEADSVEAAEAVGHFDLAEALHLSFFDLEVRYIAVETLDRPIEL